MLPFWHTLTGQGPTHYRLLGYIYAIVLSLGFTTWLLGIGPKAWTVSRVDIFHQGDVWNTTGWYFLTILWVCLMEFLLTIMENTSKALLAIKKAIRTHKTKKIRG